MCECLQLHLLHLQKRRDSWALLGQVTELQKLPCNSLQARLVASLAAVATASLATVAMQPSSSLIRNDIRPRPSRAAASTPLSSHGLVNSEPVPAFAGLVSSDITRGRLRDHFRRGDVFHGRHVASSIVADLRSFSPYGLVRNNMPTGRPVNLRPRR